MDWYGQITPANWLALSEHFGGAPPWPMDRVPHVEFARAVLFGGDLRETAYYKLLLHGREDRDDALSRGEATIRWWADKRPLEVELQAGCVIDGNHRWAVGYVLGVPIERKIGQPYQTVIFRSRTFEGRRLARPLIETYGFDVEGAVVADLGAAEGMYMVEAAMSGATHVYAMDVRFSSVTWQLMHDWCVEDRVTIIPRDLTIEDIPKECTHVFACSVVDHIGRHRVAHHIKGRMCFFEDHGDGRDPGIESHTWRQVGEVPYSRAEPEKTRRIWIGEPR